MKVVVQSFGGWLILFFSCVSFCVTFQLHDREMLLEMEKIRRTGGNLTLRPEEEEFNSKLMKLKEAEIATAMETGLFPPAMHFFKAKELIEKSAVFDILKKMPKGGLLHIHDYAMVSPEWLIYNISYLPHCYVSFCKETVRFKFSKPSHPKKLYSCSKWILLETYRKNLKDVSAFDKRWVKTFLIVTDTPEETYPTQASIWKKFESIFKISSGLINYAPVFKSYLYQGLLELYKDNVQYVEIRVILPAIYEANGKVHGKVWSVKVFKKVAAKLKKKYPDFLGLKLIYTTTRYLSNEYLEICFFLLPTRTVGWEDGGKSLFELQKVLWLPKIKKITLPYFFHAGETGAQVLKLVSDLRNHPAAFLLSEGYPIVVSSDDPAIFGSKGLSHDFYEMFMGVGGMSANLRTIKQLVLNSFKYSSMKPNEKKKALGVWEKKWNDFIESFLHSM
ncbi:PREDICTED: adenosine deaminase CECR1 [Thamnophis sirtalis]|uniref:Adenosine deaminase CECR1 n=1 Tax=Thamnophis sirtalis TaxID=35019 RepID=A0A6I9XI83_9SAUR|nr:PREDICTED: adenosine deaminase CECR1 [Thamnophis sirtalis]